MSCPTIVTVKYWNILLWKVKISSDKDATGQARQLCWHRFNCNWSCSWARKMDWIRSSWAMGRQWHILGGPGKAPEEFNLVFLFLPTFSFRSSVSMSLEECCTYSQSVGQEGSRAIRLSLPRGTFWALPVASWGDTCSMFIAFPQQKWTELCEGHATPAAEIPWRLALLFLVKFRSTTEEHGMWGMV